MAAMSDYLENLLLNFVLRGNPGSVTAPATVYLALYTSNPTDGDTGTEVSSTGTTYARQAITFGAPASGATENTTDITFQVATADWGTITHIGVRDASTNGHLLFHGALTSSKTVATGDQFKIASGDLDISLD